MGLKSSTASALKYVNCAYSTPFTVRANIGLITALLHHEAD